MSAAETILSGLLAQSKAMRPRIEVELQDTQAKAAQLEAQLRQVDKDIASIEAAMKPEKDE